jgi:hypothetical protein
MRYACSAVGGVSDYDLRGWLCHAESENYEYASITSTDDTSESEWVEQWDEVNQRSFW